MPSIISTACWSHETHTRNIDTEATSVYLFTYECYGISFETTNVVVWHLDNQSFTSHIF